MHRLILSTKLGDEFVYKFLPKALKELLISELLKNKKSDIVTFIKKEYRCELSNLCNMLSQIKVDKYKNIFILHFNTESRFKSNVKCTSILKTLNSGTIDIKGIGIIDKIIDYSAAHINYFYSLYLLSVTQLRNEEKRKSRWL